MTRTSIPVTDRESRESTVQSTVQSTRDYSKFKFMAANRDVIPGHVARLAQSIEAHGNLTKYSPILVNEDMEVIDGQNRLIACQEMNIPVYYIVAPGLRVQDAVMMNITHRGWEVDDYAKSYAAQGMTDYQIYVGLKERFGISHKILMSYLINHNADQGGMYKRFREGNFVIEDLEASIASLNQWTEIAKVLPYQSIHIALAFRRIFKVPGYSQKRMLEKLIKFGSVMQHVSGIAENLRQLEEIYNYRQNEDNRLRLY